VPTSCSSGTYTNAKYSALDGARTRPIVYIGVFGASQAVSDTPTFGYELYQADYTHFIHIPENNYPANEKLQIAVSVDFLSADYPDVAKDYTVNVYNKQAFNLYNSLLSTSITFMDGSAPSGFTDTPVGTGVGQFATGTRYMNMGPKDYTVTPTAVEVYRQLITTQNAEDIEVYSLLDAMIKAKDFL